MKIILEFFFLLSGKLQREGVVLNLLIPDLCARIYFVNQRIKKSGLKLCHPVLLLQSTKALLLVFLINFPQFV